MICPCGRGTLTITRTVLPTFGSQVSSPLGLTDCGSEDDCPTLAEPFSSPEQDEYHDTQYPCPYMLSYDGGEGLSDSTDFSTLMESLSNEPRSCDDGVAPVYAQVPDMYSGLEGYSDLGLQSPGFVPTLSSADGNIPVTAPPGPASFFDGDPALDS